MRNLILRMTAMLLIGFLFAKTASAQSDTICKKNGNKIVCKILEVGTNAVSFKIADALNGPTYTEMKENMLYIVLQNGQRQYFSPSINNTTQTTSMNPIYGNGGNEYKITSDGKHYFLQGKKIGLKQLGSLLSQSGNPAVAAVYKTSKLVKAFQVATKIISFPSTGTGGVATIVMIKNLINESKNGGTTSKTWIGAGISVLGTIAFPVGAKILKNSRNKLYGKAIDLYNIDKK